MPRSSFGHVRQRTNGRWQARYQTPDGRQHSKTCRTKDEAAGWLRDEAVRITSGEWVDRRSGRITLAAWADKVWPSLVVGLRLSTAARDRDYFNRYALPGFGAVEIGRIDRPAVDRWVVDMSARLAPATVHKAAQVFAKVLRAAVRARLIAANPFDGVQLPRIEREEMRFLTPRQIGELAATIDRRYSTVVWLGAVGGLRAGELFGLRAGRVLPGGVVDIVENVVHVPGIVGPVSGPPKTRAGRRRVHMPPKVAAMLAEQCAGKHSDDYVFEAPMGGPVRRTTWETKFWRPAVAAAGLSGLRLHDLRHTAVALWIAAGATPVEIARRAGHTSVSVVLDRYGHLLPGTEDRLASALDDLFV